MPFCPARLAADIAYEICQLLKLISDYHKKGEKNVGVEGDYCEAICDKTY